VLIVYATAVVRGNGDVYFFDDIYGHDAALDQTKATLIPIGNLPTPYATDIDVNEVGLGVIPYAPTAKGQRGISKKGSSQARQPDVDGLGLHMQAVLGDAGGMGTEKIIAPGGSIAADHV
jgi:hypothetical protein